MKTINELYLYEEEAKEVRDTRKIYRTVAGWTCGILVLLLLAASRPPNNFQAKSLIEVKANSSVSSVATLLKENNVIASATLFKTFVRVFNPKNGVLAGQYYFDTPTDVATVAFRLSRGDYGLTPVKFRVTEGTNAYQLADMVVRTFPDVDHDGFLDMAKKNEGYLFPDTYFFSPDVDAETIVEAMRDNFDKKINTIDKEISAFGKPLADVIKMASYLEEEARLPETRRTIAGILWKRESLGMALQVDPTVAYGLEKNPAKLSKDDLQTDNPYNTYTRAGLTPTPISNPGLDSIEAAVTPIDSKYLYFIADSDGIMHYATTIEEHVANIQRYLR